LEQESARNARAHFKTLDRTVLEFIEPGHQAQNLCVQREVWQIEFRPWDLLFIEFRVETHEGRVIENRISTSHVNALKLPEINCLQNADKRLPRQ
jgi:hypothetical protein